MRFCLLFLLLASLQSPAQTKSFEGEISYLHLFRFKQPGLDTADLLHNFGSSSRFIFKEGSYHWVIRNGAMTNEYYSGETGDTYDRYEGSDTLYFVPDSSTDTMLEYKLIPNADTISGYVCDRLQVKIGNTAYKDAFLDRTISFSRELPLDPEKFRTMTTYCAYEIYKITRSVHLRIEMNATNWPFSMCFQAVKISKRPVKEEELRVPPGAILKKD